MKNVSVRDAKIAIAIISIAGTVLINIQWGSNLVGLLIELLDFDEDFVARMLAFAMFRLPSLLAILGAGFVFLNPRHSRWMFATAGGLWILLAIAFLADDGDFPPTSAIFGAVFMGFSAYLVHKTQIDAGSSTSQATNDTSSDAQANPDVTD